MTDRLEAFPEPANRNLTYPWWLVVSAVALFLLIAAFAAGSGTLAIDQHTSDWVQDVGDWSEPVSDVGNLLGETPYALGLLVIALIGTAILRNLRIACFLVLAAIGRTLAMFLKEFFDSPRPNGDQVTLAEHFDNFGFPSGHATTSAVLMGTLAFLVAWFARDTRWRWFLVATALVGVILTAFARIDVGAHWLTDTIGGALVGTVIVLLAANLSGLIVNRWATPASPPPAGQTPAR